MQQNQKQPHIFKITSNHIIQGHNSTQMSSKFNIHTPNHQFKTTTISNPVKERYTEGKSTASRTKTHKDLL